MKNSQITSATFDNLYKDSKSERTDRLGEFALLYNVPKYVVLFSQCLQEESKLEILELGAGVGEITTAILAARPNLVKRYVATEISEEGVKTLRSLGVESQRMDAQEILFGDSSFDVVCCFDVMHHVTDCKKMAHEMTRVARKYVFLIEANGLCIFRKLLEITPDYKKFNERSYPPWEYKSFFPQEKFGKFVVRPFLFTPPGIPRILYKPTMMFNEVLERIPALRWQCSSVAIFGKKKT